MNKHYYIITFTVVVLSFVYFFLSRFTEIPMNPDLPQIDIIHLKDTDLAIIHFFSTPPCTYSKCFIQEHNRVSNVITIKEYQQIFSFCSPQIYIGNAIVLQLVNGKNDVYYYSKKLCTLSLINNRIEITNIASDVLITEDSGRLWTEDEKKKTNTKGDAQR